MALRPTFDRALSLVAKTLVEAGSLKAVRCEDHLGATSTNGLRFGCVEERPSQASTSMGPAHPEVRDLGAASPGVATEACDDFARFIPNACAQERSIKVPCRFGVELVDTLNEERIHLLALRFVKQHNSFGLLRQRLHCTRSARNML